MGSEMCIRDSHDNIQSNNKQRSHNLDPDLFSISINRASGVRNPKRLTSLHRGKDARKEPTEQAAHGVGVHVSKDVVDGKEGLGASEDVHAEPGDGAGADADDEGAPAGDDAGGGGDGDEAGDFAFDGAEDGGFFDWREVLGMGSCGWKRGRTVCNVEKGPDDGGDGGAEVGVEDGNTCVRGCLKLVSSCEREGLGDSLQRMGHHR